MVATRLVEFAAAMFLLGSPLLRLALAPSFAGADAARADFDRWLRAALRGAAVVALAASLLWLDVEAVIMGGGWHQAVDPDTIATVLTQTEFGHAWQWHLGFTAALLVVLFAVPVVLRRTGWITLAGALAVAQVASLAWAGHAVMRPGAFGVTNQVVHLLAGAVWLGSLPPLFYLLGRARQAAPGVWQAALRAVLPRYSRAGYVAVGLVLVTGCLNSWFLVASWHALIATDFGHVLLVKIALVVLMVATALANRLALAGRADAVPIAALRRNVAVEQWLGLGVLAAVSLLGTLAPAM
jgi:putative copper resistance protein D